MYLPVSLGEAMDKLTILDIKMDKIKDHRVHDVKKEYDLLYDELKEFIVKYDTLYKTMKKVNVVLWDMMDILRDGSVTEEIYLKTCKECIEYNDTRFRVKNKINYVSGSFLKEQKSYKTTRLVLSINVSLSFSLVDIIKYFSFMYDEIIIDTADITLKEIFKYDSTILFKTEVDYKKKVIINKPYTKTELYELFEITEYEINKII
jgi:hypothetical protein